jgi:phospholipase/carboxylesterase
MIHKFIATHPSHRTLVLFHGTGGDENDLIPLARMIDQNANILSLRGSVLENGMPRFFSRLRPGVFDEKEIQDRVDEVSQFLEKIQYKLGFKLDDLIAIGYSNGANMIAQILLQKGELFHRSILLHPMDIAPIKQVASLNGHASIITAGKNDPIMPPDSTLALKQRLEGLNVELSVSWFNHGHSLSSEEIQVVIKWYKDHVLNLNQQMN